MSATQKDFYRTLGVTDSAEVVVIKAAYKALMMVYHPDRFEGDKEEAIRKTKEINEAYSILIDPEKRKRYASEQSTTKNQYEPEQEEIITNGNNELEAGWLVAVELVKGLDDLYQNLNTLSKDLAFTFKLEILETKRFDQAAAIAEQFEADFIEKYFGKNKDIQKFSRWLLSQKNRSAAKEINKLVAISGSNLNAYDVIESIKRKYYLNYYQPEPVAENFSSYKVGDILHDNGIVFYIDQTGHGLIAHQEDSSIKATWHEAKELTGTKPKDWHLPNKEELKLLYEHRHLVGGFANHLYWSSTESDRFNAWFQNFCTGHQLNSNKNLTHRVRTVRAF